MLDNNEEKGHPTTREYEGSTVEDAINIALAELKVSKEKIKIQILTEGQRGLFGMEGAKKAKIRVTILFDDNQAP